MAKHEGDAAKNTLKAGTARTDVTPSESLWLGGYHLREAQQRCPKRLSDHHGRDTALPSEVSRHNMLAVRVSQGTSLRGGGG